MISLVCITTTHHSGGGVLWLPCVVQKKEGKEALLQEVAEKTRQSLQIRELCVASLQLLLDSMSKPRMRAGVVQSWFGDVKKFPDIARLVTVIEWGVPVDVLDGGRLSSELAYGNHRSTEHYLCELLTKVREDVMNGRAFVLPRQEAPCIPEIRVSPLGIVASHTKIASFTI